VTPSVVIACLALAVWLYLVFLRGGFWLGRHYDESEVPDAPGAWPAVSAVIPARDEAELLPTTLQSLLAQDYPGPFAIVVVDDQSSDGTQAVVRSLADGAKREVELVSGAPLPAGWTGKVWAMHQGTAHAEAAAPDYFLLTDADIDYAAGALRRLVARAKGRGLVLTSMMAELNSESLAERALIPAFVFFFQMLYPFSWVNCMDCKTAAAAGGCMLVDRRALARAGGVVAIRGALIDDCALAALLKKEGPIWLGLSHSIRSLRACPHFGDIRRMVARSAYAQLRYSPLLLIATVAGMAMTFFAGPVLALFAAYPAELIAASAWALMTIAYLPILRSYRLSPLWAVALPVIAAAYVALTLDSACQHWRGKGGLWKGRSQAFAAKR